MAYDFSNPNFVSSFNKAPTVNPWLVTDPKTGGTMQDPGATGMPQAQSWTGSNGLTTTGIMNPFGLTGKAQTQGFMDPNVFKGTPSTPPQGGATTPEGRNVNGVWQAGTGSPGVGYTQDANNDWWWNGQEQGQGQGQGQTPQGSPTPNAGLTIDPRGGRGPQTTTMDAAPGNSAFGLSGGNGQHMGQGQGQGQPFNPQNFFAMLPQILKLFGGYMGGGGANGAGGGIMPQGGMYAPDQTQGTTPSQAPTRNWVG